VVAQDAERVFQQTPKLVLEVTVMKAALRSNTPLPTIDLIPAAQYVRMSDDGQQFSIANQKSPVNSIGKDSRASAGHGRTDK
jgi:hypothetical protein